MKDYRETIVGSLRSTVLQKAPEGGQCSPEYASGSSEVCMPSAIPQGAMRSQAIDRRVNGMALCQAFYGAVLVLGSAYAFFTNPADFAYDITLLWAPLVMITSAISLWLLHKHARVARNFAIVGTLACAALAFVDLMWLGAFPVLVSQMGVTAANLLIVAGFFGAACVVLYLLFAREPHEVLREPLNMKPTRSAGHSWDVPMRERVRTWPFWRDILIYFTSFAFLGHWGEMLFCMGIVWGIFDGMYNFGEVMLWHQWLFPYLAEAVAMVLVVVLLHPFKEWLQRKLGGRVLPTLLVSILVTALVCTTIDFSAGMICNQDYAVWDYRDMPFNFMGQICLQNSTVYTLAATVLVWVVYPLADKGLRRMPKDFANMLCIALVVMFVFCGLLHFAYVNDLGQLTLGMVMNPNA